MSLEKVHERWFDLININSVNGREIHAARYVDEVLKTFGMTADWSYGTPETVAYGNARQRPPRKDASPNRTPRYGGRHRKLGDRSF